MQLRNSEFTFSYYNNLISAKAPDDNFDINQLIEVIKYGYLKDNIDTLRNAEDKASKAQIKKSKLPCVTLSGTFTERNKNNLEEHSGLMQIDIDDLKNYDEFFNKLIKDPYTYVAFKSPSGNGVKLIVKVNPSIDTHLEQFLALQKYYLDEYNIEIDKACKDIARCMLLSFDPDLFCNPFSEVYAECFMPEKVEVTAQKVKVNYSFSLDFDNDRDLLDKLTHAIEQNQIDITSGYLNWIRIGFALGATLGEDGRDYFHRLSRFNQDYSYAECDKKYTNLTVRNNGSIRLGTLIYIAKENGVEVKNASRFNTMTTTHRKTAKNKEVLYEVLKAKRLELANKIDKPAFTIFTNKTLEALVDKMPMNTDDLLDVYGISYKKCKTLAQDLLPLIISFNEGKSEEIKPVGQKYTLPKLSVKEDTLYEKLRDFRLNMSREKGMKAFYVFGNSTLNELVEQKPTSKKELLAIKGIGNKKIEEFGEAIIGIVKGVN